MMPAVIKNREDANLGAAWRRLVDAMSDTRGPLTLTSHPDGSFTAETWAIETDAYSTPIEALEALEAALEIRALEDGEERLEREGLPEFNGAFR